jgi:hypothetical protein
MNFELASTPWTHDELQLIGAELGDTITYVNEHEESHIGLIVQLTKTVIFVLTEDKQILKFGRMTLSSTDGKWDMVGLAEREIRISKEEWQEARNKIAALKKTRRLLDEDVL